MANILAISVFLVIFGAVLVHSKYLEGHLKTEEDWHFLARFCFLSQKGQLQFEFEYPLSLEPQNILLYYDDPDQWPAVYKSNKTCQEKQSPPHLRPQNNQIVTLYLGINGCEKKVDNSSKAAVNRSSTEEATIGRCVSKRSFRSARERWWFVASSRCDPNGPKGLNLKYKIWMTNGDDFWHKHFSADEFYILPVDIAFLIAMLVVLCVSIYTASVLKSRQMFHTTYKLYMVSLTFEVFHLFIMCIAYGKYANDGLENYGMRTFGRMFESASILVFLLMLILMGKGYTITRGRLSTGGSVKISIFMTLFVITYAVLFIYEAKFFDPGEVLYIYESPAGYGLVAMRLLGWIWFCYAIFFTLKHYPEKARFYYPFFIFYTL